MVSGSVKSELTALAAAWLLAAAAARGAELPDYQVGDTAQEDVRTPVALAVINPEDTAALKEREASRVPVICRYYTNAAKAAEAEFVSVFAATRSNFLKQVQATFQKRKLDAETVASARFERLAGSFQRQNRLFPVTTNLAALWARGEPDRVLQSSLVAALREAYAHPMRPPDIPVEVKFGSQVRMVPLADFDESITLEMADRRGFPQPRTNIVTFTRSRDDLLAGFPPEDRLAAKFLVSLLKTNCVPDAELTAHARARRTTGLTAADNYEPGQIIVKRWQVVDRKAKAALDQLREKLALQQIQQQKNRIEPPPAQVLTTNAPAPPSRLEQGSNAVQPWIIAVLAAAVLALAAIVWRLVRPSRTASLLPVRIPRSPNAVTVVECAPPSETVVMPAAATAEPVAETRTHLVPHLVRLMREKLFQKLVSQQRDLLDTQTRAAADMADMEARLEKIQAPLQDRLRAYEQRIVELEKELAQKGEENRALIQLKIQMVRNQVAATKDSLELN
jgi:hypothetical protein